MLKGLWGVPLWGLCLCSVSLSVLFRSALDSHTDWKLHSSMGSVSLRQLNYQRKEEDLGPSRPSFKSHLLMTLDE